jgi:hypothetical protein
MASVGHTSAHAPQSVQRLASIAYLSSPSLIALTGHSSTQVPHEIHSSVILYAMGILLKASLTHAAIRNGYKKQAVFGIDRALRYL